MKKKFLSVLISLSLILSCMAIPSLAANPFPDVLSPDHDWASSQIQSMTNLGIIKGYTDGTFKPDKAISKIEAVILFSRVSGYSNSEYAAVADLANEKYQYLLQNLNLDAYNSFKKEIAFLVYKGIVKESEIVSYLDNNKYLEAFPRKDAAKFIANLMEANVGSVSPSQLSFADKSTISSGDAGYIAYVVNNGFMNGVQMDNGSIVFDANGALSRAQVCVLLYRIMGKLNMTIESGTVTSVNASTGVIRMTTSAGAEKSYTVTSGVKIFVDGYSSYVSGISTGSKLVVVKYGSNIRVVEAVSPEAGKVIRGTVESIITDATYTRLSVRLEGTGEVVSYYAAPNYTVTSNGMAASISSIYNGDYVVVRLVGTEFVSIERGSSATTSATSVEGTVKEVYVGAPSTLTVLVTDYMTGSKNTIKYNVASNVVVYRDGGNSYLRNVSAEDNVVLTIAGGQITQIVANSVSKSTSGVIKVIKIAAKPSLTITSNGVEQEYPIAINATYSIRGERGDIYDLRIGTTVKITVDSSTITKIVQNSSYDDDYGYDYEDEDTFRGYVKSINTTSYYINVVDDYSGDTIKVYASEYSGISGAKVINGRTGRTVYFEDIERNDDVEVEGYYSGSKFIATRIIIDPEYYY